MNKNVFRSAHTRRPGREPGDTTSGDLDSAVAVGWPASWRVIFEKIEKGH